MKFPLDKDCFVTSITLAALRKFGDQLFDMDPLLVRDACEDVFKLGVMPQRMFDKLNCGLTLIGTTAFTDTIEGFLACTATMNGMVLDGSTAPFCTLEQCAWSVWEYINLNGDIDSQSRPTEQFSPDVVKYIQEAGRLNGVVKFPIWMDFAQRKPEELPDMSEDVELFESYMRRQDDYIDTLKAYVTERQNKLTEELLTLKKEGFVG